MHQVRPEAAWPLPQTRWTPLHLHADGALRDRPATDAGVVSFDARTGRASFTWRVPTDLELTGPMALRLHVKARGADDIHLFIAVRLFRHGREVTFEGSYGFPYDVVTKGWLKASLRRLDAAHSASWRPEHPYDAPEPLQPGEVVPVTIELLPSAAHLRRGEMLRLDVQGRWFFRRNPLCGQFPAAYQASPSGTVVLHYGGAADAHVLVPVVPAAAWGTQAAAQWPNAPTRRPALVEHRSRDHGGRSRFEQL